MCSFVCVFVCFINEWDAVVSEKEGRKTDAILEKSGERGRRCPV